MMRLRRRSDDSGVDVADQLAIVGHGTHAKLVRHAATGRLEWFRHSDELDFIESGGNASMNTAEMASADHGDTQLRHAALLASRLRPCRPSCCVSIKPNS